MIPRALAARPPGSRSPGRGREDGRRSSSLPAGRLFSALVLLLALLVAGCEGGAGASSDAGPGPDAGADGGTGGGPDVVGPTDVLSGDVPRVDGPVADLHESEDVGGPPCVPKTCAELAVACGPGGDGCGRILDCGPCPSGEACESGVCVPTCGGTACQPLWSQTCVGAAAYTVCGLDDATGCPVPSLTVPCEAGHDCVDGACDGTCVVPELLIVLDRSSSMAGALWDGTRDSLSAFADDFQGTIELGLRLFPGDDGCTPGTVVPISLNNAAFVAGLVAPSAGGSTPLAAALDGLGAHFGDPNEGEHVLVISDGSETCSTTDAVIGHVRRLRSRGTTVHTIGVGPAFDVALLDAIAAAGGGTSATAADGAQLLQRLRALAAEIVGCPQPAADGVALCRTDACLTSCHPGFHACGAVCASNTTVDSCGTRCAPCPDDPHGSATCQGGVCGLRCQSGYHLCDGHCVPSDVPASCGSRCAPCPTTAHAAAICRNGGCDYTCDAGYHRCTDGCRSDTSTDSCGNRCAPCPSDPNGTSTCVAGACELRCGDGFTLCADGTACCTFTVETVETSDSRVGTHASLVLDGSGTPHLAYTAWDVAAAETILRHARRTPDGWRAETAAPAAVGDYADTAIVVDGDGLARITHEFTGTLQQNYNALRVSMEQPGGYWLQREVLRTVYIDWPIRMALDAEERSHIAWLSSTAGGDLMSAVGVEYDWTVAPVLSGLHFDATLGFALDRAGASHYTYCPNEEAGIRYVHPDGAGWAVDTISEDDWRWWDTDLALDGDDSPHILWRKWNITTKMVRYTRRVGGVWTTELVDTGDFTTAALALDPDGRPHVVYVRNDANGSTLLYATRTATGWQSVPVATSPQLLTEVRIAVDTSGFAHFCFHDERPQIIKYVYFGPP